MTRNALLLFAMMCCGAVCATFADAPPIGWTTQCRIVRVVDGDTLDVEVTKKLRVRLLDCWAPETRTTDATEKERGLDSAAHLRNAVLGKIATLHIPGDTDFSDTLSFSRLLGRVYVGNVDLSEWQVRNGHATERK